jgi:hypothetical protein
VSFYRGCGGGRRWSLIEELDAREAARETLSRLVITWETVAEVMAETSREAAGTGNEEESAKAAGMAQSPFAGASAGDRRAPKWQPGLAVDVLSMTYQDITEVVADAPGPVRAKQIVSRIGLPRDREDRGDAVEAEAADGGGWLDEETPGLFATAAAARVESVNSQ